MKEHDNVTKPQHYMLFNDIESIEVIARSMSERQFYGYCLGNTLKYRLRAGNKGTAEEDLRKSEFYKELYEQYSPLCYP